MDLGDASYGEVTDVLVACLDRLGSWRAADLPAGARVQHLLLLDAVSTRIDGLRHEAITACDAHADWAADGARTAPAWLAARTEAGYGRSRAEVDLARDLRHAPHVRDAFTAGRIGQAKARLLTRARTPELAETFTRDERLLVDAVAPLTVAEAGRVIARWTRAAREATGTPSADGRDPDPPPGVYLSPGFQGRWVLTGDLDPATGEALHNAIGAEVDRRFRDGTYATGDGITAAERRARALAEIVRRGLNPTGAAARPLVMITADLSTLLRLSSRPGAHTPLLERLGFADLIGRACELATSGPVPSRTLGRHLCEADLVPVITRAGQPLALGRTRRLASEAQWRALRLRDRHCTFPGCDAPAPHCHAHHIHHWEHGGPTDLGNLTLLCSHHHTLVHTRGFHLARGPDGALRFTRPDGQPLTPTLPDRHHPRAPDHPRSDAA